MWSGHSCPLPLTFVRRHHEWEGHESQSSQATHSKPRLQPLRFLWKSGASAPRKPPMKSIWASAPDDPLGAPSLRFLQEPALSGVEGVGGDAADRKSLPLPQTPGKLSLVIPNRAESAVRNLPCHAAEPPRARHRGSYPSQGARRVDTHCVISASETKARANPAKH
jgi:hypothetical protein